jgi:hypothetical protein
MKRSGLSEILECWYGPVIMADMLSGKAVARVIHVPFLLQLAQIVLLLEPLINFKDDTQTLNRVHLEREHNLCKTALDGQLSMAGFESSDCLPLNSFM